MGSYCKFSDPSPETYCRNYMVGGLFLQKAWVLPIFCTIIVCIDDTSYKLVDMLRILLYLILMSMRKKNIAC
uniref:Uncharacterized protein n=1 Tax=Nelumbo nucifera TaxID=4432 RepID=A0A822YZC0_NELNU|nr:TPA_asm: hypothetical protein HUJ06_007216 [Nelumbo nucifera]